MKIVVDTNIVFSAILNANGKIGDLLLNKPVELQFVSPSFLLDELSNHTKKILQLTRYDENELLFVTSYITTNIEFIDTEVIGSESWEKASDLLINADQKDIAFLALALDIDGVLWTGDKKLIKALQYTFNKIVTTDKLYSKYFE